MTLPIESRQVMSPPLTSIPHEHFSSTTTTKKPIHFNSIKPEPNPPKIPIPKKKNLTTSPPHTQPQAPPIPQQSATRTKAQPTTICPVYPPTSFPKNQHFVPAYFPAENSGRRIGCRFEVLDRSGRRLLTDSNSDMGGMFSLLERLY